MRKTLLTVPPVLLLAISIPQPASATPIVGGAMKAAAISSVENVTYYGYGYGYGYYPRRYYYPRYYYSYGYPRYYGYYAPHYYGYYPRRHYYYRW